MKFKTDENLPAEAAVTLRDCGFDAETAWDGNLSAEDLLLNPLIPLYESPTYTANLCPLWGQAEFANLGEDFDKPIGKSIEATSLRAIRQGPTEHLDGMLSEEQRVDDTVLAGAGRNCWRFGLWNQMSRFLAGQMVLALQIIRRDVDVPHRHLWIGMAEQLH